MKEKVSIIIPSLNPDEKLMEVVNGLIAAGFKDIVIVNDGSDDEHKGPFIEAERKPECVVLVHEVNKGKGRGLKTAFSYVLNNRKDSLGVITVDGDNQHQVKDIEACMNKMIELKNHVVLGCRDFSGDDVPARSKFGNNMTKNVFKYLCGLNISDTQTGLRGIPREYLEDFIGLSGERFEYETNMLLELKEQDIPYTEVKINTVYIEENATSHFNPLVDSIKIYKVIFKFMLSSVGSCILDLLMFTLLLFLLNKTSADGNVAIFGHRLGGTILIATIGARIVSSIFNFTMNKKAVFKNKTSLRGTLFRYYVLCIIQMSLSAGAVAGLAMLLRVHSSILTTVIKAVVDTLLFMVSFPIQRKWVFKK